MGYGNNGNLIPNNKRTPSELREMTQKGGKASGVARRKNKTKRQMLKILLDMKPSPEHIPAQIEAIAKMAGLDINDIESNDELLTIALFARSINDINHHKYLDEIMGRNPQLELKKQELNLKKQQLLGERNSQSGTEIILKRE